MEEQTIENAGGDGGLFTYIPYKGGFSIKKYRGIGKRAVIPPHIDGKPVTAIARKAFLSCKTIREIVLPGTVEELGDWAFAHAEQLRAITIPDHGLRNGKELFLGCKRLREIVLSGTVEEVQRREGLGLGKMLALAVTALHDYFLLDPPQVGQDAWVARWDRKLMGLVETSDLDGFEELWTCGEEDYEGKDYDIKSYPVEKRKMKLRIVYFRLLHPYKLSDAVYGQLKAYLSRHTKGTEAPEAWDILIEEHKEELEYYKIFTETGCVTAQNFDALLADMAGINAEIKAYMLRYKEDNFAQNDAFAAFELDW